MQRAALPTFLAHFAPECIAENFLAHGMVQCAGQQNGNFHYMFGTSDPAVNGLF